MHLEGERIRFTPSDLTVFLESEFASWMDRWALARRAGGTAVLPVPGGLPPVVQSSVDDLPLFATAKPAPGIDCRPDAEDPDGAFLRRKGEEHERAVLGALRGTGLDVRALDAEREPEATRTAMASGPAVLYQAPLADEAFAGRPDFLVRREDGGSPAHYEPREAKLARRVKPEHVVQLCAYADLLEHLQGVRPAALEIVLGDGSHERLPTDRYFHYYRHLRRAYLDFQRRFDPESMPHPGQSTQHGRWSTCAARILEVTDHLRGIAGIRGSQIRKLEKAGIATLAQLAAVEPEAARESGMRPEVLQRLVLQARLQRASRGQPRPLHAVLPHAPGERRGLSLLPPASTLDVFFDMEGHPLADGPLEYLFGAVHVQDGEMRFADWWALGRAAEQAAFEAFVDWVHGRWRADPGMHVYHYNAYETAALKRLMGTYGSREREVDDLLRNEVFVDLYRVVRAGLVVGAPGYSLKDIEPIYRSGRAGDVTNAEACMAAFERWLDAPDGAGWETSAVLRTIRDYNRVDCESTLELAGWLRSVQREAGIEWVAKEAPRARRPKHRAPALPLLPADADADDPGVQLARSLAADMSPAPEAPADERTQAILDLVKRLEERAAAASDAEDARLATLLGHLLEFHRREMKPAWWRTFERAAMSEDELEEDLECLAGLERTATPPAAHGSQVAYEYAYDPDQDTKLQAGDRCLLADDLEAHVRIVGLDADAGRVQVLVPGRGRKAPERTSLVPDPYIRDTVLQGALSRFATAWLEGRPAARAVDDFLRRRPPRIAGHAGGPIVPAGAPVTSVLERAVHRLLQSTLCIQGPPGTGKTWTASHVILELLREGRSVGVMAHGHKAILNLMAAVRARADEAGVEVLLVKVGGSAEDAASTSERIVHMPDNKDIAAALAAGRGADFDADEDGERPLLPGRLVGGTAWAFARPEVEQALDVLFVDEAGQVSIANLVAAGCAARNLVLVGDQMQLAQPVQGSHPGESGGSALGYLLQDQATIPDDFGVFLATTHRMHPEVCGFVSEAVYEGRLHADPKTARRRIVLPPASPGAAPHLRRGTGIVWIPVDHRDNAQSSEEEVEVVAALVVELLGARFHDEDGDERQLGIEDVLCVAPYNMQVRRLQRRLPRGARVGSVDRFQGLEAPVAVVSMCASSLDDVPRGLEFLLSPNRLNVAVSRAQCLAVVVGSPTILASRAGSLEQMERLNLYGRLVDHAERLSGIQGPAADAGP